MLSLRLKTGECLDIGPDITVHVYRWRGDSIELAVSAPREVPVTRRKSGDAPRAQEQPDFHRS